MLFYRLLARGLNVFQGFDCLLAAAAAAAAVLKQLLYSAYYTLSPRSRGTIQYST